ncbi:MAG: sigma-70 family RNA polymerase sigma factor [Chloroflexi bacterium]|nr:sigma-70 family RNA polymerase sigma factor [Chloroflexota bacterium]
MPPIHEKELLAGFDPADADTFAPLVLAYQNMLIAFAGRMLGGSRADAEDVAQEAFLRAFRHLQKRPKDTWEDLRLTPWLYKITLNLCRDRAKEALARGGSSVPVETLASQASDSFDPGLVMAIESAMRRLPPLYHAPVVMRHVDQLAYHEIAAALDVPLGTAKARVHRGTRLLRELLTPLLEEDA